MPTGNQPNLLSIGEFARQAGLSASAVRFYVDAGLLDAEVQASNGYRLFDAEQVARAELVRQLRALGMSLKDVGVVLRSEDDSQIAALIDRQWASLQNDHAKARTARAWLRTRLLKEMHVSTSCTIESHDFRSAVHQVLPAVGSIPEHPAMSGIQFEITSDSLSLLTTDRYRIAARDIVPQSIEGEPVTVVLEAQAVRELCQQVDTEPWVLTVNPAGTSLRTASGTTELAAITGDFPDCRAVMRQFNSGGRRVSLAAAELNSALRTAGDLPQVILDFGTDCLTITGDGLSPVVIDDAATDEPFSVVVNPKLLLGALVGVVGPDVVLRLNGPLDPIVISSADDGTFTSLVMPIRT